MNYLQKYIDDYAQVVQPLYNLIQLKNIPKYLRKRNGAQNVKKVIIEWTESPDKCFNNLKQILCSELVLSLPDFEQDMIITTDASDNGYGAVLEQYIRTEDGSYNKRPIEYFSKSYTPAQKNYSTTEKELLAVVMSVEHFHSYVYGRKFTIYTDHLPNTLLWNKLQPHPRVERWMMRMELYQFEIKYKPGHENVLADFLSRPQSNEEPQEAGEEYLDQLVAGIETIDDQETINYKQAMNEFYAYNEMFDEIQPIITNEEIVYHASEQLSADLTLDVNNIDQQINYSNINVIASEPNSNLIDNYKNYAEEQLKDDDIQWIKHIIINNPIDKPRINQFKNEYQKIFYREYNNLYMIDNVLYRITHDKNGYKRTQFVLPKQIPIETKKQIHSSVYHAHLGRNKTIKKLTDRMYKPFLKREIIEVVKTCDTCQKIKRDQSKKLAEMLLILPTEPNQMIATDIGGPLKETKRGNKYFIVLIDHFTKFIQIHPLKRIQAEDVAQILIDQWMMTFGT